MTVDDVKAMAERRPLHQLRREQGVLPERQHARPTSSAPGRTSPSSTRSWASIDTPVRFDEVMDFSVIKKLDDQGHLRRPEERDTSPAFAPTAYKKVSAEKPILTQTIRINFYPNSANIYEPQHDELRRASSPTPSTTPTSRPPWRRWPAWRASTSARSSPSRATPTPP